MDTIEQQLIVATYSDPSAASQAVERLQHELPALGVDLPSGALLTRTPDGGLEIRSLRDAEGVSTILYNAGDVAFFLGLGAARIAFTSMRDAAALMLRGSGRLAALAGAVALLPLQKMRGTISSNEQFRRIGDQLETGDAAVVLVASSDLAENPSVQAVLVETGGHVVEPSADASSANPSTLASA